jgi:hypothetical protein
MDLNSRINWFPGMEITAQTFIGLEEKLDFQQQIAIRAALGSTQMGLLPGTEMSCKGVFVKNTFEVENVRCMALLPSGKIIDADEKAVIPIPMLFGDSYYLTIGISDTTTTFEKEGVPYVRPHYEYSLLSLDETEAQDVMPLLRFNVSDGVFSIDTAYIPPCLLMTGNDQFAAYLERYVNKLSTITSHQNLEEGDGKRALLHYLFIMKGYSLRNSVHDFVMLLQEIAHAVDYYIISPNTEQTIKIPEPSQVDIMMWLSWFEDYLTGAVAVLDKVVLVDNTIDYDALLRQAKAELYAQLHEELIVKLLEETKEKLIALVKEEMQNALAEQTKTLTDYINDQMKPALMEELRTEMNNSLGVMEESLKERLYERLYQELFEHLFNALYVPEPESERFVPLI